VTFIRATVIAARTIRRRARKITPFGMDRRVYQSGALHIDGGLH
jgi:hypothetical protein